MAGTMPYHAMYTRHSMERSLPSLPSPTLTNPDMVLPDDLPPTIPQLPSPRRANNWNQRPPSPGYLQRQAQRFGHSRETSESSGSTLTVTGKREQQLGMMSRKMMLLRSESGHDAPMATVTSGEDQDDAGLDDEKAFAPSPANPQMLQMRESDIRNKEKRPSWGSRGDSDQTASTTELLERFDEDGITTDDGSESVNFDAFKRDGVDGNGEMDSQLRRQQEEQASLMLSQRAEEILANAKERLKHMGGNLRPVHDHKAPLTAANLKRATSVGSTTPNYRGHYGGDGFRYDSSGLKPLRTLQSQTSSPSMLRDYRAGHWRGVSETWVSDRPRSALNRTSSPITPTARYPVKVSEQYSDPTLKGTKSYDSLGRRSASRELMHVRNSPESVLERVDEDSAAGADVESSYRGSQTGSDRTGRGSYRAPSRTDDLREQMSSLQGRISSLRERTKEDSLRRQSMQSLREPSPLNNAVASAPEFYYTSSPAPSNPTSRTKSRLSHSTPQHSPSTSKHIASPPQRTVETPTPAFAGSRNAFAEQAARKMQQSIYTGYGRAGAQSALQMRDIPFDDSPTYAPGHRATLSDSVNRIEKNVQPDLQLFQQSSAKPAGQSQAKPVPESRLSPQQQDIRPQIAQKPSQASLASTQDGSTYEDAPTHQPVAHEDREDAFDYEHFFLHSNMSRSRTGFREADEIDDDDSTSSKSSTGSISSAGTARGPTTTVASDGDDEDEPDSTDSQDGDEDDAEDDDIGSLTPSTPETPGKLQEIERDLQAKQESRSVSRQSTSTHATFATANEVSFEQANIVNWPIPASMSPIVPATAAAAAADVQSSRPMSPPNYSRPTSRAAFRPASVNAVSRPNSRPTTAIPNKQQLSGVSNGISSDRVDSGVGGFDNNQLGHAAANGNNSNNGFPLPPGNAPLRTARNSLSPPISPNAGTTTSLQQNPETAIVNLLLDSSAPAMGMKDKALLFGIVHSLRQTVRSLQSGGEGDVEVFHLMRDRLEKSREILGATNDRNGL